MRKVSSLAVSRREMAGGIVLGIGGVFILGCGSTSSVMEIPGAAGSGGSGLGAVDSGGSATSWASGGTKSMTGIYADPFATPASTCVILAAATEGPCTEVANQVRKDISEGYTGLPLRLALRVVDGACNPVAGATVKVWHTQINGSYSGNTPNNGMCLKDQADAAKHYFRGVQTSDTSGRLDFDTCFPGWYRGRAIHIHYTVSQGGKTFTSQLVFEQALIDEIFTTHPEYAPYGLPDTPNASDNVVGSANLASFTLATKRMDDGAMLAWKELVLA
jgi:protocatechuate 3,4-dioxygenase beta subunit